MMLVELGLGDADGGIEVVVGQDWVQDGVAVPPLSQVRDHRGNGDALPALCYNAKRRQRQTDDVFEFLAVRRPCRSTSA